MILFNNLKKSNILVNARFKETTALFDELLNLAVKNGEIQLDDFETIKSALTAREKSMTTGIGKGLAIPHCVSPKVKKPVVMLAIINEGMNFAAIDEKPVYIVVLIVFPESKMSSHVKALAEIAQIMNNNELMQKLAAFKSPDGVLKTIKSFSNVE
ncbi:MAG: PTS sugar transporter subunit IIA [Leptospirales bacterium]|nr:PTS sugar transporter subunit IIA [Leptospirales bacterium]